MMEFLAMGGYAAYVWPAYAIVFAVLGVQILLPVRRHRQLIRDLDRGQQS
ncbi:heme exporter protein CcmD [Aquisalimonas lutea]|nr:heme exporter protein CcmD [Aquisalimonas lutea]MDN3519082.1 heme exporter protein CcmD [Aquisalimonas lutea]